jgi:hypothetical protein
MSAAEYEITNKELNMLNMVLGRRDNFFFFFVYSICCVLTMTVELVWKLVGISISNGRRYLIDTD